MVVNDNNAPAVSSELEGVVALTEFSPLLHFARLGVAGVSSMETNAWRLRGGLSFGTGRVTVHMVGEAGILLDLPQNELFATGAASVNAVLVPGRVASFLEVRGASLQRYETGGGVKLSIRSWEFLTGAYYRQTPSAAAFAPLVSCTWKH